MWKTFYHCGKLCFFKLGKSFQHLWKNRRVERRPRGYLFFEEFDIRIDLPGKFVVRFDLIFYFIDGMKDGGMVFAAEVDADFMKRGFG